ncbi:MAG: NAD-dependent epimerase/dehydratase family protein [Gorillibacterium sp.]|nr:NAD-dependent epimerase/dehydratase family protein [Gorillibacterium sp.]
MSFSPSATMMITGASGFVGGHACEYFAALGLRIIAVVSTNRREASGLKLLPSSKAAENDPGMSANLEEWACELTDRDQVRSLMHAVRPDYVLHLAGRNQVKDSWQDPVGYLETNLLGTVYLLDALRQTSSQARVLVAGSMLGFPLDERPNPPHPYSLSKAFQVLAAQSWGKLFNQDIMVAQPANLIGPGPSTGICALLAGWIARREKGTQQGDFVLTSLTEQRDFLDVRDAVKAFSSIFLQGESGESYRTSSGVPRSLGELLEIFRRLSSVSLDIIAPALSPFPEKAKPEGEKQLFAPESAFQRLNSPVKAEASSSQLLGWSPSIPFEQSIEDTLHYFRDREGQ